MQYQILIYSLSSALLLSVVAIGFNVILNAIKVFHLAHGAIYVTAVVTFSQIQQLYSTLFYPPISIIFSFISTLIILVIVIVIIEYLVYRPLYLKKASSTISLISSLAVYMLLVNLIVFIFGDESITLNNTYHVVYANNNIRITEALIWQIGICTTLIIAFSILSKSHKYMQIRAIMDSYSIASKFGINVKKTRIITLILGTMLVGIAGIIKAYETAVEPSSGLHIVLAASVAVIAGGVNSLKGTILACIVIALIENYSVTVLSSQWKDLLIYSMLTFVLLFFKRGLMSVKQRIETR